MVATYTYKVSGADKINGIVTAMQDVTRQIQPISYRKRNVYRIAWLFFLSSFILFLVNIVDRTHKKIVAAKSSGNLSNPVIIVVTPTYPRQTRMADMTRMAHTLMSVPDVHWIIVEDRNKTDPLVEALLQRTGIPNTYLTYRTIPPYPPRGWYQRNMAMWHVRKDSKRMLNGHKDGVLYFGDDDNSYDVRVFNDYIRKVKKLGVWPVALVGGAAVEAPKLFNGKIVGFNVKYLPQRPFPIDMAGFAINLQYVLKSEGTFDPGCYTRMKAPETCFLEGMGFKRDDLEPFDSNKENNKEIFVWHTKPRIAEYNVNKIGDFEYMMDGKTKPVANETKATTKKAESKKEKKK